MPPKTDFKLVAKQEKAKRKRGLQDDAVEEIFKELVRASIFDIIRTSGAEEGCGCKQKGDGKAIPVGSDGKPLYGVGSWLDGLVRNQIQEAIDTKRENAFVLLTPQGYVAWWNSLFQAVIAISVLGAGFTFTIIFSEIAPPRGGPTRKDYVRGCLIASWMLFVMSVALASFASVVLAVNKTHVLNALAGNKKWYKSPVLFVITMCVLIEMMMPVGAFLAAAEAVRSYHNGLGIASLAMISLVGFLMILGWLMQNLFFSGPGKLEGRLKRSEKWRKRLGVYPETTGAADIELN